MGLVFLFPQSNFASQVRNLFHTLQDSFFALWDSSPEIAWPIIGLPIPFIFMLFSLVVYLRAKSEQWKELSIRTFGHCLAATLFLYGMIILALGGWVK